MTENRLTHRNSDSPFLERPIEGDRHYIWIDATYLKVRGGGRIVSVAVIIGST